MPLLSLVLVELDLTLCLPRSSTLALLKKRFITWPKSGLVQISSGTVVRDERRGRSLDVRGRGASPFYRRGRGLVRGVEVLFRIVPCGYGVWTRCRLDLPRYRITILLLETAVWQNHSQDQNGEYSRQRTRTMNHGNTESKEYTVIPIITTIVE